MRYLLAAFFFLMYAGDQLGLSISLGPGMSSKNLMLYLILSGIAISAAVARNREFDLPSVVVPFGLLILYASVTWVALAFVVADPEYPVRASFMALKSSLVDQYLTFLIFFFGLLYVKDAVWLLAAIVWLVMLGNVVTIIDTMNIPDLGILPVPRKAGRFEGFLKQPNEYGKFLALFLPACVALFVLQAGKVRRSLAGIGILATVMALILTGSRGAYVGVLGGAMCGAFFLRGCIPGQLILRASVIAAFVCAVAITVTFMAGYSDLYLERFSSIGASSQVATSGRSTVWLNVLKAMTENPLSFVTGYGFFSYDSSRFHLSTHNIYLYYLYNLGSIGLFIFIAIFFRILVVVRSVIVSAESGSNQYFVALVFGLFSFMIALVFSDYHGSGYLLWAYVGVTMRMAIGDKSSSDVSGIHSACATSREVHAV